MEPKHGFNDSSRNFEVGNQTNMITSIQLLKNDMNRVKFNNNKCKKLTYHRTFVDVVEKVNEIVKLWRHASFS
jgi:hypothetical protein